MAKNPLDYPALPLMKTTSKKLPGLTVVKVDEETGLLLADAEFSITHKNGFFTYEAVTITI